jgi:hypothetical protein
MRAPSRTAVLIRLIWVICEPMWKCSSDSWSRIPPSASSRTTARISLVVRPNFELSPPELCQRPLPRLYSLARTPTSGLAIQSCSPFTSR